MTALEQQITEEMTAAIHAWFDERLLRTDLEQAVQRTSLQVGIFSDFLLDYKPGRTIVDVDLDFGDDERPTTPARLDDAQLRDNIAPQLRALIQARLAEVADTPLIDYRFTAKGKFQTAQGKLHLTLLEYLNENKRQLLLDRIHTYIEQKLLRGGKPTKPLESFFLTRHLLDTQLFPVLDVAWTIAQFERIQQLNRERPQALAEHRSNITQAVVDWAESNFLPRYYDVQASAYRAAEYTLKPGMAAENAADQIDLLLYGAVMILRHAPNYAKAKGLKFLDIATQLGSERAMRMQDEGSGHFAPDAIALKTAQVECRAHDIFAVMTIAIKQEEASAYEQALLFVTRLLQQGFPKSYQIKLKSKAKNYLPLKGLAKSDTHRFFANALVYPELQPLLHHYARAAIGQFEWYADTEGEKNCMPGTYAVFGLALADACNFPLLGYYMENVDEEHQSVQDAMTAAFAIQYGVTASSVAALVACLRRSTDSLKLKLQAELDDVEKLGLLYQQVQSLESHEVERVLYPIWGKVEKLTALARKAQGKRKALLEALLAKINAT
ncbi:DUF6138 family protein [Janthinobacterium sp.]|uniref:DUF6138 family protein n=1 Tax=Janthinobacterium sp. TaxID=1871054 RepID=UPI0026127C95|nr:DUF6138 family protein [Janthinobacterium sp.]